MSNQFAHVSGCTCASCKQIRRIRAKTRNQDWDHIPGCGCGNCRNIENLRQQKLISDAIKRSRKSLGS